jgi:hypothetical protein
LERERIAQTYLGRLARRIGIGVQQVAERTVDLARVGVCGFRCVAQHPISIEHIYLP